MSDEDQVRGLLKTFERALDTSDVALAAGCYMKDAVAMGAGFPTLAGEKCRVSTSSSSRTCR